MYHALDDFRLARLPSECARIASSTEEMQAVRGLYNYGTWIENVERPESDEPSSQSENVICIPL